MTNHSSRRVKSTAKRRRFRQWLFETLEARMMLADDTARQPLTNPAANAPIISAIYVTSPTFTSRFAQNLVTAGIGKPGGFLEVPTSGSQSLPWTINGVKLAFSENVDVAVGDLYLRGVNNAKIEPTSFNYDAEKREATWGFPSISNDRIAVTTSNYIQSKLSGKFLDAYAADSDPTSSLMVRLDVLTGDINKDGLVTASDYNNIRNTLFSFFGSPNYSIYNDANADALITASDINPIKNNLFASRPRRLPDDIRNRLAPGISKITYAAISEDSGLQSVVFAVNSSTGAQGSEGSISLKVTSSNQSLLPDSNLSFQTEAGLHRLRFETAQNQWGVSNIVVTAEDAAGLNSAKFQLEVQSVNDAPFVSQSPGNVTLLQPDAQRSFNLDEIFGDVDDTVLSYRIVAHSSDLFSASISGTKLSLATLKDKAGKGQLELEARDAGGLTARLTVPVEVLAELDTIQYAYASDQVIANRGQNIFELISNFDRSERITVTSTDEQVLRANDISIEPLGNGRHRVIIKHRTNDYGVANLSFMVGDTLLSNVMVLVLPDPNEGPRDFGNTRVATQYQVNEEQTTIVSRSFNARYIAKQVQNKTVAPEVAFSIIRPATPFDILVLSLIPGAKFTQTRQLTNTTPYPVETGLVDLKYETPKIPHFELLNAKTLTPTEERIRDVFFARTSQNLWSDFNPFENPFVLVPYGQLLVGGLAALNPITMPIAATQIPLALKELAWMAGGSVAKAAVTTRFETDPTLLGSDYQEVALNLIDLLSSGTSIRKTYKEILNLDTNTSTWIKSLSKVVDLHLEYLQIPVNLVNNHNTSAESKKTSEMLAFLKSAEDFTTEAMEDIDLAAAKFTQNADPNDPDLKSLPAAVENAKKTLQDVAKAMAEAADEIKKQAENGPPTPPNVTEGDLLATPAEDEATKEKRDENASKQTNIVDLMKKAGLKPREGLITAISVGKQIVDIAKATKSAISQVEGLFAAGSDENRYIDQDGSEQRLDVAQNRHGTVDRDNINTGMKNDTAYGYAGNDRISTGSGADELYGGSGRNVLIAGPGNDLLVDGEGDSQLIGDAGDDTIRPGKGSDFIDGGLGRDTIELDGSDFGRKVLLDPTREGIIRFTDLAFSELELRKDRYDLLIEVKNSDPNSSSAIRFSRYFENDAGGWEIVDKFANHYNLYALTGRISTYEALQIAFRARGNSGTPVYPTGLQPLTTLQDDTGRYTIHIAEDRRAQTDNTTPSHRALVLTFEGDNSLTDWLTRNSMGALPAANGIIRSIMAQVDLKSYDAITIVGIGEGGLVAQWFGAVASTQGISFVYSHLINTPDVSGLISQVVRNDAQEIVDGNQLTLATGHPEYANGFPTLHNNFIVNSRDWISRFGLWSGNDEMYATWKAYEFESQVPSSDVIPNLAEVQAFHSPRAAGVDFSSLRTTDLTLSQVRGVVSFTGLEEMRRAFANVPLKIGNEVFDSTIDARNVLSNDVMPTLNIIDGSAEVRASFLNWLQPDPTAVNSTIPFKLNLDFQAAAQRGDHLAAGHQLVTESTLFNPALVMPRQFGWESKDGVFAGIDRGRASELERDSLKVQDATFIIDLAGPGGGPGTYNISITIGDREELQESLQIAIDGFQVDRVSTMPGDFLTRTYQISTTSSQLRIQFVDLGGKHASTSINGISIEKVNYRDAIPDTETIQSDPALTVVIPSYELPETNAGIEIFKQALIAAATAAATAGIGAALSTTSLGASIPAGLGGSFEAGLKGALKIKDSLTFMAAIKSVVGPQALQAAGMSLFTSVPQNLIPSPTVRGILGGATSIFMVNGPFAAKSDSTGLLSVLEKVHKGLDTLNGALAIAGTSVAAARGQLDTPPVATWVYEVVGALATMTQQFRLGRLDTAFEPVDMSSVEQAIDSGKPLDKILKLWQGSRDFLVLDWVPDNKNLTQISKQDQLQYTNRAARVLNKLIEAYSQQLLVQQPDAKFDLLQISHGAGYEISRELTKRLNSGEVAKSLDYVQLVTLDPYASTAEKLAWYRPEFTTIVDRVVNLYQTEKDNSPLYHGGSNLGGLDGREGGSSLGMYNQAARLFSLQTNEEILRLRNYDFNEASLSDAELTDIRFNPDGSLVAIADKNGNVSVRYTRDIPKPGTTTGELLARAGQEQFRVWGHEQLVRAVSFVQIEQDGVWKDYLLSISAARDPKNTNPNKNKIVLTDLETRMPVWQGTDIGGTHVAASPNGNVLVSTDSSGHAKVWKRVAGTITFEALPDLVDAHTNANRNYVADVIVINERYFVTAGLDGRAKLFAIDGNTVRLAQPALFFDDPNEGEVHNLAYDPYNGILAIAAGETTSLWRFNQLKGQLVPWGNNGQNGNRFVMHDHVATVQGLAFDKPDFLLDADGNYSGDRQITLASGTRVSIPRTDAGDIDQLALEQLLTTHSLPPALKGLNLLTGGEDRTVLSYTLDNLKVNAISYDLVLTGNTLPVRELDVSSDGRTLAVVGIDNIFGDLGGPVDDRDVTDQLDSRLEWKFSEIFLQGRREHNATPFEYIYSVIEEDGEAFFWLRNSNNANRPGNLDPSRNLAVPFNKQNRLPGVDIAPLDFAIRPSDTIEIKPLQFLLEADREKFALDQDSLPLGDVRDANGTLLGSLKLKRFNGQDLPNVLVFTASDNLDYSATQRTEFVAQVKLDINGPTDSDGNTRRIEDTPLTIRIINHKPIAYKDTVDLFPTGKITNYRPASNDYDPDNDSFALVAFPATWQLIPATGEPLARVRANPEQKTGIDVEPLVDEARLAAILQAMGNNAEYINLSIPYTIQEQKYSASSTGTVDVRLRLPSGPENVRYTDLGADLVTLQWNSVTWAADRYVVERWDELLGWQKHSNQSFAEGRTSDSITISVHPNSDYWFRIVAVNTNSGRREASYTNNNRGGLFIRTPDYVGPSSVEMETLGPTGIEVRWNKVYWNVERYVVVLRELLLDSDGQFMRDSNGEYLFDRDTVRVEQVPKGNGLSFKFTKLKAGTPYLAIVSARNDELDIAKPTFAAAPVFTEQRLLPSAIELERVGPVAVRLSWSTVGYAEKYRVVVIDPISLERVKTELVEADKSRSRQTEVVLELPKPNKSQPNEWGIFIEAKRGNQWLSLMQQPIVLPLTPPQPNESQIKITSGAVSTFVLPAAFNVPLRLPSLSGLSEGTEFILMNFSRNSVRAIPFSDNEQIGFNGYYSNEQFLVPSFGSQSQYGAIAHRVEAVVDSATGKLRWSISTNETASQAVRVQTPPYLASEKGTLQATPTPYRMAVQFTSPYWNVTRHKIEILTSRVINGLTFWFEAAPSQTFWTDNSSSDNYQHTFKGLKPNTTYLIQLTTTGPAGTYFESITRRTEDLQSPIDPDFSDVTLRSFKATWSKVAWAQNYRVVLEQKIAGQWTKIRVGHPTLQVGSSASSLSVQDLEMGSEYRFTVEARSGDPDAQGTNGGWIENDKTKIVKTLDFKLPTSVFLAASERKTTALTIDWSTVFSTLNADDFYFGADRWRVKWKVAGSADTPRSSDDFSGSVTQAVLTGLTSNTNHEVWVEFQANGLSQSLRFNTQDNQPIATRPHQPAKQLEIIDSETGRHRFTVKWRHDERDDVDSFTVLASTDLTNWFAVGRLRDDGSIENGTNLDKQRPQFEVTRIRNANGDWDYLASDRRYYIKIRATFNDIAPLDSDPISVFTLAYPTPSGVSSKNVTSRSLELNWSHDTQIGNPDRFNIWVSNNETSWSKLDISVKGDERSKIIQGLEPGTRRWFKVEAEYDFLNNQKRMSNSSPELWTSDPNVQITSVQVDGKKALTVIWASFNGWEPDILQIQVQKVNDFGQPDGGWFIPEGGNIVQDKSRTSKQITGLSIGTTYNIQLITKNSQNREFKSAIVRQTTEAMAPITGLNTFDHRGSALYVQWKRLEIDEPNANVTRNQVEVFLNGTLVRTIHTGSGQGQHHSVEVTGLNLGTTYQFKVTAFNDGEKLSQSALFSFTTFTAATNVQITPIAWQKMQVSWNPPSWSVEEYVVKLFEVGSTKVVDTRTPPATSTWVNFGNLKVNQGYYATVVVKSAALKVTGVESAESPAATTFARTAPALSPIVQVGSTLTFSWTHFAPPEIGTNLRYRIERRIIGGAWNTVKAGIAPAEGQSNQSFSISRQDSASPLNAKTTYEFRIVAVYAVEELNSNIRQHQILA